MAHQLNQLVPAGMVMLCLWIVLAKIAVSTEESDVSVLRGFYKSMNEPRQLAGWKMEDGGDPCQEAWTGVACSGSSIVSIQLSGMELNGTILLRSMRYLESLNLSRNSFTGSISNEFTEFPSLKILDLSYNRLGGPLPSSFSSFTNLTSLFLQRNKFEGSVLLLQHLPLDYLWLQMNRFSGPIPQSIRNITNLRLERNNFKDDVPQVIGGINKPKRATERKPPEGGVEMSPPVMKHDKNKSRLIYAIIVPVAFLFLLCCGGLLFFRYYKGKKSTPPSIELGKSKWKFP